MLKKIPSNISPELLFVLASMGHGDELVLADAHFPTSACCRAGPREVRADGQTIPQLLRSVLQLMPLDTYVGEPVMLMAPVPADQDRGVETPIWDTYRTLLDEAEGPRVEIDLLERFDFYKRAKQAFAIVHTGERAQYGNIILKKGVVREYDTES
ncbi:fucose mutarotase-like [Amphibalanus amphitrite]|nr:fucose mutarotase-like [Amphibalanus amphitrite]XP_043237974.1 fucose mutarotase-like [Amphibalanus amphitrite]XP_043237982.1 fucose mutarotase-like [Amphibalanus amphitrite]XP_043237990.1 fucose mutarotase-like [Amphibalanus amphitrite]XP_043237996.1 fucose mutarotase-like [Amphibalanus amphitrite]